MLFAVILCKTNFALCSESVTFAAVGDVLLDRDVRKAIQKNGVGYPFELIAKIIKSYDLAFCNLECPLSEPGFPLNKKYVFRGEPGYVKGLAEAGFNVVSLANNHSLDHGREALLETMKVLSNNGLYPVGSGANQKEARAPTLVQVKGLRFAFFGYLDMLPEGIPYLENKPAPAYAQTNEIVNEIRKVRNKVDFVIVSFHWGRENQPVPTMNQVDNAHAIIDAGADIVLGHHPHVLQNVEIYKGRPIVYSLGNFVFDNHSVNQKQSMIFGCEFEKGKIFRPYVIPVVINALQPQIAEGKDADNILSALKDASKSSNVQFIKDNDRFYISDNSTNTEFNVAIGSYDVHGKKILVYTSKIVLLESSGEEVDTLALDDPLLLIRGVDIIVDGQVARLYVILGSLEKKEGGRLSVIPVDLGSNRVGTPSIDSHKELNPWKIVKCDVDGDGNYEICLGVWKKTRYDGKYDNRLFVFSRSGNYIYPKWLGSKLMLPFQDFSFQDIDADKAEELLTLELQPNGIKRIMSYRWNRFGFAGYKEIMDPSDATDFTLRFGNR